MAKNKAAAESTAMNGATEDGCDKTPLIPNSTNATEPPTGSFDIEDLKARGLQFLSTASNETLWGMAVGMAAGTYLLLGRVGLLLIGVVGGIVLHASWEGHSASSAAALEESRKQKGLNIVKRVLDSRDKEKELYGE